MIYATSTPTTYFDVDKSFKYIFIFGDSRFNPAAHTFEEVADWVRKNCKGGFFLQRDWPGDGGTIKLQSEQDYAWYLLKWE